MPYARPTLTQLRDQALQDINTAQVSSASGVTIIGLLQKAILRVMAYVQAGFAYLHYGFLDYIAQQAVPVTATDEFMLAWAALKGVTPEAATFASGSVSFAGAVTSPPLTIAAGTGLVRSDGVQYTSSAAVTVSASPVTIPATANVAGAAGNCDAGTEFSWSSPPIGMQTNGTAATAFTGGADAETDSSVRTRMLQAYAAPPQGGDRQDYIAWALDVPGVTRAWVWPNGGGAGTVWLYAMLDTTEAAHQGFPQGTNGVATNETRSTAATGDQLTIANAIFAEQPVTALVSVFAPDALAVNFTVANLGTNNTAAMQTAITAALTDMFLRLGNVGGTVDPATGAAWPAIDPSAWYEALGAIGGLTNFTVTAPSAPITPGNGQLPVLGAITFQT